MRLLAPLLDAVFPSRDSNLTVREISASELLAKIRVEVVSDGQVPITSLFPYADTAVQACILEAKFHDNARAAELLGHALHEYLYEMLAESCGFSHLPPVLIPLPLARAREKERGYNQTERIARAAAASIPGIETDTSALWRTRDTVPQTSLSGDARRRNILGAFSARTCDPDRTYIVVDDVVTTGSTMAEAISALRCAGARHLFPVTLAH